MKNWQHMIIMILTVVFWTGCSSKVLTKTVYLEPKKFEFVPIEINVTEVKKVEPIPLKGKIEFIDNRNESIKMSVNSWLKIRRAKIDEHRANIRLRIHKEMYKKANKSLNRQIRLYLNSMK